jgi:MFS family permease
MLLLLPSILYSGMCMGFFGADFRLLYATPLHSWLKPEHGTHPRDPLLPSNAAAIVLCVWLFGDGIVSVLGGRLAPLVGRSGLFLVAGVTHTVFLASLIILSAMPAGLPAMDSIASWALVLSLTIVYSLGEGVLQPQLPAVLQSESVFPSRAGRRSANANMRVWQPLGFALQMGLGAVSCPLWAQASLLLVVLLVAALCFGYLHRSVCSIDGTSPKEATDQQLLKVGEREKERGWGPPPG